jgi:uncharacterized protein (TIGR00297 family)
MLLLGLGLGALIGYAARRAGALSAGGAWAAALSGGLIFGLGGLPWAVLLLAFFLSSSLLSRLFTRRKAAIEEKYAKGARRDAGQVLANGGLAALLALAHWLWPEAAWPWAAFAGALAAVNADTWATELGVLNPAPPRLITTGRAVERGTSGGVSLAGYAAALGGAGLIALGAALFTPADGALRIFAAVTLAGLLGSTLDSLLGAGLQAIYTCPNCRKETERHPQHTCGAPTTLTRGWRWLNNDAVNFLASLAGAALAVLLL